MTGPATNTAPPQFAAGDEADPTAARATTPRPLAQAGWRSSHTIYHSVSIVPATPDLRRERRHWRAVTWRLQFHFWRGMETLLRLAIFGARPDRRIHSAARQQLSTPQSEPPWRRQLSIGHGCSGPHLATPSVDAIDMGPDRDQAEIPVAVCVVGSGDIATELIGRLLQCGVRVHATAETVEAYVALRSAGAVPHRFEDLPAVARGIDILISTSFGRFVGATVVAALPASAVIVDLAAAPGSIDFEHSKRLGHQPIWAPSAARNIEQSWGRIRMLIEEMTTSSVRSVTVGRRMPFEAAPKK